MDLVEFKRGSVYCDSLVVAKSFDKKHHEVVRIIKSISDDIKDLRAISNRPKVITEEREYRGNSYTAYLMNREFFTLLVMRMRGKRAVELQLRFNEAFYMMEERIISMIENTSDKAWIDSRVMSKIGRREETDVIKDFVDYATKQGSKKAKWYYKHITNATYKALGLMFNKKPALRDTLNLYQISELILAEKVATNSIKKWMAQEMHYSRIYELVKDDLCNFAKSLRLNEK